MKCRLTKEKCPESETECPWWVKMIIGKRDEGRCAVAWVPIILVEIREAIERAKQNEVSCTEKANKD